MTIYTGSMLRINADGSLTTVRVSSDDDDFVTGLDAGNVWSINDVVVATDGLELQFGWTTITQSDGTVRMHLVEWLDIGGTLYLPEPRLVDLDSVTGFSIDSTLGTIEADYQDLRLHAVDAVSYSAYAVQETYLAGYTTLIATEDAPLTVLDDDGVIEFSSETGSTPVGEGFGATFFDPATSDFGAGDTTMVRVSVEYLYHDYYTATLTGSFTGLMVVEETYPDQPRIFYLPETGAAVDVNDVIALTSVTVLGTSPEGDLWTDYKLVTLLETTVGNSDDNTFEGSEVAELYNAGGGNDTVYGNVGADVLNGDDDNDLLFGGVHDDTLDGGDGDDTLHGGLDNDSLLGGLGADTLYGGRDDDTLDGQKGADALYGDHGNDSLQGDKGADTLDGGEGHDTLEGEDGDDSLSGQSGADSLLGGIGLDTLLGGDDWDTLDGGAGEDVLRGGNGHDRVIGGEDNDSLRGNAGHDVLEAGKGDDLLRGDDGDDDLAGGRGNDTLLGNDGADTLNGGDGVDQMTGGAGPDVFVLVADGDRDVIYDYEDGKDKIDIDVSFAALTITTVLPGVVEIIHAGDTLLVQVLGGGLVATDFTASDFI